MMRLELEREMLSQPVRALQYMLNRLSLVYEELPAVLDNGMFDERTLESVLRFQQRFAQPVTGVVDRRTWEALRQEWDRVERERVESPRPVRAFPGNGRRTQPGEWKEYMMLPQAMFGSLSRYFNGILPAPANGLHGEASAHNVRWLQRAAGLEPTGVLDQKTWDALSRLYEVFIIPEGVMADEGLPTWG